MTQVVRFLGLTLAACVGVKVLAWAITPVLPLLVVLFVLAVVWMVVMGSHRHP